MSEGPNLTLPPADRWMGPARRRPGPAALALAAALAVLLCLQAWLVLQVMALRAPGPGPAGTAGPKASAAALREVAVRLQRDNLHSAAAQAYEEYLQAAGLGEREQADLYLEIGNLLAKAGRFEEAMARYFRASPSISAENEGVLRRKIQECLQRLGKHAEQGYELKDQLAARDQGPGGKTAGDQAAGAVLAWIGPEKITASDLDDLIAREIEERAAAMPGLPPERITELKAQAQKQLQSPQARRSKLQEYVAKEVLYREGCERKADEDSRVQRRIADFRREAVIEEMVLSTLRDRIKVTEGDLRTYYRANTARYAQKASARVRIAILADEAKAKELLAAAKTEEDFERIAKENSMEPATRERGGLIEEPLAEGGPVPGLGAAPELTAAIFATLGGHPIGAPVKVSQGFAIAFVKERTPERTQPFEEVREKVGKDYFQEKEAEVQGTLVKELFEKHRVSIQTEQFIPGLKDGPRKARKEDGAAQAKDGTGERSPEGKAPEAPASAPSSPSAPPPSPSAPPAGASAK